MGKLTAVAVKAALVNPDTYQDGEGLFLKVDKRGGAYWNLRALQDGKRRDIGIGSAKLRTMADARHRPMGCWQAFTNSRTASTGMCCSCAISACPEV